MVFSAEWFGYGVGVVLVSWLAGLLVSALLAVFAKMEKL